MQKPLACVLLVGLLLRLGMAAAVRADPVTGDAAEYAAIAKNLVARGEFAVVPGVPTASRPPVYPAFLTLFARGTSDSWPAARFAEAFVDVGTAWLVYAFGVLAFRREAWALAGALLYAVHPVFVGYSVQILTEPVFLLAWMGTVCLWLKALEAPTAAWAAAAGLVTGLTILCRPNFIFFPPGAALLLALWHRGRPDLLRRLAILLVFAYAALVPWSIRNRLVMGAWIPVATMGGPALWCGAQPAPPDVQTRLNALSVGRSEIEVDAEFYRMAKEDYRKNWRAVLSAVPKRFLRFWLTSHSALFGSTEPMSVYRAQGRWGPIAVRLALLALQAAVLALGAWGVWEMRRDWTPGCTLTVAAFGYYSLHLLTGYWTGRYHLPALALLVAFSGASVVRLAGGLGTPRHA